MESNGRPENLSESLFRAAADVCARCGGLMVSEYYIDLQDDTGHIDVMAWRCTSCGEVIDPVILRNRSGPTPNLLYGTKQRSYAQRIQGEESNGTHEPRDHGEGSQEDS